MQYTVAVVWDCAGSPNNDTFDDVILWRSYGEDSVPYAVSIPSIIEENAEDFRRQYLAFIHDLGETKISGKSLVEHFEIQDEGFSHWWMSLLAEKCNFSKSPHISDIIKIFVLELWIKNNPIDKIKLVTSNKELSVALRNWCILKNIEFETQLQHIHSAHGTPLKRTYRRLPHRIQALLWLLVHILSRWSLRGVGVDKWRQSKAKIAFVSYFFNLVPESANNGFFESHYWTELPKQLSRDKIDTNWLHIFVSNGVTPTPSIARKKIEQFNENKESNQCHVLLDGFLNIHVIFRTVRSWLYVGKVSKNIVPDLLSKNDNVRVFWPLIKRSWSRSFYGTEGISNLLMYELFSEAFAQLPSQKIGVYLQENQGWEPGFLASWRGANHGRVVGFPHSTVRYWDLRRFFDPRIYHLPVKQKPLPDYVACGGDAIVDMYNSIEYPATELIQVEALRFLYLSEICNKPQSSKSTDKFFLLVVGDAQPVNTSRQLMMLKSALEYADFNLNIVYKPHPLCNIDLSGMVDLNISVKTNPISDLLLRYNIVYSSTHTSAAVDAYCAGKFVISMLEGEGLNTSPLRSCKSSRVKFVSSPKQLSDALKEFLNQDDDLGAAINYFNIDNKLPKWRSILNEDL